METLTIRPGGIPNLLENVYPSPDGLRLYTPYSHANILRGMYLSEEELTHETSLRAILGHVDWTTQTEDAETRKHFDEKGRTSAVAFSEFGDLLYVLHLAWHRYPSSIDSATRF